MVKKISWLVLSFFMVIIPYPCFAQKLQNILLLYEGYKPELMPAALLSSLFKQSDRIVGVLGEIPATAGAQEKKREALRNGCDFILTVIVRHNDQGGDLTVEWVISSPFEDSPRSKGEVHKKNPSPSELVEIFWLFLLEPLNNATAQAPLSQPPTCRAVRLTIRAHPGTFIEGLSQPVVVGPKGSYQTVIAVPTSLVLTGKHYDYKTEPLRVFLTDGASLTFLQTRLPRFSANIEIEDFAFVGLGLRWDYLPNAFFIKLGGFAYDWSFSGISAELIKLQLGTGGYFPVWTDFLRFSWGIDVGMRLTTVHGFFSIDPIIPVQFQPYLGLEVPIMDSLGLYLELSPFCYAFNGDKSLFNHSLSGQSYVLYYSYLLNLAFELVLHTKLGLRWSF